MYTYDKVIFATGNKDKLKEINEILRDLNIQLISMREAGINIEIIEDGCSYEENALIKARAVSKLTDTIVMADDSGLEIDYLNGAPGIFSARYLGEDTSYTIKNNHIIKSLENAEGRARSARFVCAIAVVFPNGKELTTRGIINGTIAYKEAGENGFGYDPIFWLEEYGKTTAELSEEEKNKVSHRGKALELMKEVLKNDEDFNC